ncbi:MAG: hypothetical protein NTV86_02575 [Planctomycetota bacterium]|nr:hypothetical protein [Planctomycetota bacterium]
MFYKATNPKTGNMWDVWLYYHAGTYYLYSLCTTKGAIGDWDNISVASSPDGVHWTEIGPALTIHQGATWMGTGSTWGNPVAGGGGEKPFQINYSIWAGPRQTIFFATSDDLVHWTPTGPRNEFVQDERWYERNGRWDCIWTIARPGGGLYGYWTASPKPETGGQFGFGESLDGLTWTALEPPKVSGVGVGEVGAIEKIGAKYYMLFGTNGRMETLVADRPQGPFATLPRNKALLSGHTYFARFFNSPTGLLACHHSIARDGRVFAGLLKGAAVDADGILRFTWWPGNDALKHKPLAVAPPAAAGKKPVRMLARKFDAQAGFVLEGKMQLPEPLGAPRGLYVEHGKGCGTLTARASARKKPSTARCVSANPPASASWSRACSWRPTSTTSSSSATACPPPPPAASASSPAAKATPSPR